MTCPITCPMTWWRGGHVLLAAALVTSTMMFVRSAGAEESAGQAPSTPATPATATTPATPWLANVARVRIEVSKKSVVVIHDVNLTAAPEARSLARAASPQEDVETFLAFGAPGAPRAVDARLLAVPRGALEAPHTERRDAGTPLSWSYARKRPPSALSLLGRASMAGVLVQIAADALTRSLAPSGMATLRVRSLLTLPAADSEGQRDLVIRLGEIGATPLVLGRVELVTHEAGLIEHVEARLCRTNTGAHVWGEPVAVRTVTPEGVRRNLEGASAAILATRRSGEDLCVRFAAKRPPEKTEKSAPAPAQKSGSALAAPDS